MIREIVKIVNPSGLQLYPAGELCRLASQFPCAVYLDVPEGKMNVKSVMSILNACVPCGKEVAICCDGEQEQEAMAALTEAIRNGLGEKQE